MERLGNVRARELDNDLFAVAGLVRAVAVLFQQGQAGRGLVGVGEGEVVKAVEDRVGLVRGEVGLAVDLGEDEAVQGGGLDVQVDERAVRLDRREVRRRLELRAAGGL